MLKISLLIVCVCLFSCTSSTYHFYSPEKDQCISVITENNIRYIIDGEYNKVPKSNFVKIDLSKIDRNVGDEIIGCWKRDNLHWIIMMDNVVVLENKLDTNKFLFKKDFPVEDGIPNLKSYDRRKKNCFSLGFEYSTLKRMNGDIQQ
ncbi:hypothetical protein SAMN05421820_107192 [Pedobacter steynii]|uniref:Lipoprotein n=1 Tax=Pedobacter steynii TaxID=430522 RepID=A0A1H0ATB3_9SPHI|nr:hypothetical protein [Pedobacter steynii]NQX41269.1 hypothetical protein [Pedobacter steynii]SDN36575.1 hypothetical protein SAMN05421820_107192 [Pedobacter steynii]